MADQQLIRNISDTARWVAMYRAMESERADALFVDPYARRLAGERGEQIAGTISERQQPAWAYMARTLNFDRLILAEVARGADMVVNLAAGLDTRPYRLELPPALQWIEVDLPELIAYKEEILREEKPVCRLERIALDLANVEARRALFAVLSARAKNVVIVAEGLLIYLTAEENAALARDLAAHDNFQSWIIDLVSPGLLKMVQKQIGDRLRDANAPLKFAPPDGLGFFRQFGWEPVEMLSMLKTAAAYKRVGWLFRLFAKFPDAKDGAAGSRPWSAVCLLRRSSQGT
jgi:methyltransferase (TIGR00027 family)